jgi:dTMP kinase
VSRPPAYRPRHDNEPRHPFIVLEGVSGIGKSTLARALTRRVRSTSLHTLPEPHAAWSHTVNARLRALPQFGFYLSGLLHAADSVRLARSSGAVVADRYVSSVIACHAAPVPEVSRLLEPFRPYLEPPTHTFYLTCSRAVLRERMATKEDVKQDDRDLFAVSDRLTRLLANFEVVQEADPTAHPLDTDGRSADDLADWIAAQPGVSDA